MFIGVKVRADWGPLSEHALINLKGKLTRLGIQHNDIAILNKCDWTAV